MLYVYVKVCTYTHVRLERDRERDPTYCSRLNKNGIQTSDYVLIIPFEAVSLEEGLSIPCVDEACHCW